MIHLFVCHDLCMCVTWLIYLCDMTRLYVRRALRLCLDDEACLVTCFIHLCPVTWFIHVWGCFSHEYSWEKQPHTFMRETASHMSQDMNKACHKTRFIHLCGMIRACAWPTKLVLYRLGWNDSLIRVTRPIPSRVFCFDDEVCLVTWLIHLLAMTHSYVCHDSFVCVPWLICVTWLIHLCGMTLSFVFVRRDSFICETCLVCMWDMTRLYLRHDSFICETWLVCMWDMTRLYVRHDSLLCEPWLV